MVTPAPSIRERAPLVELRDSLRDTGLRSLCVINDAGMLVGIVTYKDLQSAFARGGEALTVGDICSREIIMTTPDEPLGTAIRSMAARDLGRLPVVTPGTHTPIGMLSRIDVVRGYDTAISRKIEDQHTVERLRLHTFTGARVLECPLVRQRLSPVRKFGIFSGRRRVLLPPSGAVSGWSSLTGTR
jgi:signal-transduction protein with cAMP-binding, CBS, and nucleotidyltransferase domain